jgi:hypothetical protein
VTKGDQVHEGKVKLVADPRSPYSAADRALQQQTALQLHADLAELTYLTESVVDLRDQARAREAAVGARQALGKRLGSFADRLEALRRQLTSSESSAISGQELLRERMAELYGAVTGYLGRPTASQLGRLPALEKELADRRASYEQTTAASLPALNRELATKKLDPLTPLTREAWEAKKKKGGAGPALAAWLALPLRWH